MILMKLRDYLKEKRAVSLSDAARHFDIPESAIQSMLEHWVRKGCATVDVGASCGSGCSGCGVSKNRCGAMVYRWRETSFVG
ncbi:MAG: FeoC-like transcriptional regulator [Betaproteobacteria bacterium]|nr:FeoC-like transcriptional regulator [Betaproteobacteria bacterium]